MSLSSSFNNYVAVELSVTMCYCFDQKVSTNSYSITANSGLSTASLALLFTAIFSSYNSLFPLFFFQSKCSKTSANTSKTATLNAAIM